MTRPDPIHLPEIIILIFYAIKYFSNPERANAWLKFYREQDPKGK